MAQIPRMDAASGSSANGRVARFLSLSLLANHFPPLHGLRVLAVLGVLQFHVTAIFVQAHVPIDAAFATLSATVFFGMDLFFVLSGFLIGTMLMHAIDTEKKQHIWRFYARRSFRIFPLYYVVLTALGVVFPLLSAKFALTPPQKINLVYEYVYLTNYRYLLRETVVMIWGWSLCVEEHFYLTVPLLLGALYVFRSHKVRLAILWSMWLTGLVIRLAIFASRPFWTEASFFQSLYIRTHTRFDTLVAGIIIAYLQFHFRPQLQTLFLRRSVRWLFIGVAWTCLLLLLTPRAAGPYFFLHRVFCWGTFTSVMYMAFILLLLNSDGPVKRFLSSRVFLKIATVGYGIYLVHIPICDFIIVPMARVLVGEHGISMAWVWPLSLALLAVMSAALAYVLHILIEKPALKLRDRFAP